MTLIGQIQEMWLNWTEKTKGAIKNGQSRDTANIGHTRHRTKTKNKKQKKQDQFIFPSWLKLYLTCTYRNY